MTDFKAIYRSQAAEYDQLVTREDYQGNILNALKQIRPLAGSDIVELGAGTGRLTRLLAPLVRHICFLDVSAHMLSQAKHHMSRTDLHNWGTAVADNRHLAVSSKSADVTIAGWSLGHLTGWHPHSWRQQIEQVLAEMKRVLRPGGTLIILETLGTGRETPSPPTPSLKAYYQWLEQKHRFSSTWIRTDYEFSSHDEAKALIAFFFGDDTVHQILRPQSRFVPECTGIWWLTI